MAPRPAARLVTAAASWARWPGGRGRGQLGVPVHLVLRGQGEQPLRDPVQQVLADAEADLADLRLGSFGPAAQVDADGLLARRGDLEPADVGRRIRAQGQVAGRFRPSLGGELQVVGLAPVVGQGERVDRRHAVMPRAQRVPGPPGSGEAGAGRGVRVRHEVELAADQLVVEQDHLPHRDVPARAVRRALRGRGIRRGRGRHGRHQVAHPGQRTAAGEPARAQPRARRARRGHLGAVPRGHGQLRVGQDGLGGLQVQRPDRGQGPGRPGQDDRRGDERSVGRARRRQRRRQRGIAQLGLGQQPQVGLRALAVHPLSVRHFPARPDRHHDPGPGQPALWAGPG